MNAANRPKESSTIQTPSSTNVDCRIYSNNNAATITTAMTPMSPPTLKRNGSNNGGGVDVIQRQTVWPTAVTATDQHNGGDNNDNEGKHQHLTTYYYNINAIYFTKLIKLFEIAQNNNYKQVYKILKCLLKGSFFVFV